MGNRSFSQSFNEMCEASHAQAKRSGFWDGPRNKGEMLALIHSEISECLEAVRDGNPPSVKIPEFSSEEEELADAVIRIMDYAGGHGFNLGDAIRAKAFYNAGRENKHGREF